MEIIVKAILIKDIDNIEIFSIKVTENNKKLIKAKFRYEWEKAVDILKKLKVDGKINSIFIPCDINMIRKNRNQKIAKKTKTEFQKKLDNIVLVKRIIKNSLKKINEFL